MTEFEDKVYCTRMVPGIILAAKAIRTLKSKEYENYIQPTEMQMTNLLQYLQNEFQKVST